MQMLQVVMYSADAEGTLLGKDATVVGSDGLFLGVPCAVYSVGNEKKSKKKLKNSSAGKQPCEFDRHKKKYARLFPCPLPRAYAHTVP